MFVNLEVSWLTAVSQLNELIQESFQWPDFSRNARSHSRSYQKQMTPLLAVGYWAILNASMAQRNDRIVAQMNGRTHCDACMDTK